MTPDMAFLEESPPDHKKWMAFFGGRNSPDLGLWRSRLCAVFGLSSLKETWSTGRVEIQVLYIPSFSPECTISIREVDAGARISFVTYSTNLWQWLGHDEQFREALRRIPRYTFPDPPARFEEHSTVSRERFSEFIQKLPPKVPLPVSHSFMDGIGLHGEYRTRAGGRQVFYRMGQYDPASFQLAMAVCDLARAVLGAAQTQEILARVNRYFDSYRNSE